MIKPFYQGQLDTFCAIYAVLNALRLLRGLKTLKGRDILNDVLISLAGRPKLFREVLTQETDYISLVDSMLQSLEKPYNLKIHSPFSAGSIVERDVFWQACMDWMGQENGSISGKTMVFRFMRYLIPGKEPLNRHWTTLEYINDRHLRLFDSSHEAEAILSIPKDGCVTEKALVDKDRLLYVQPDSIRFIALNV